MAANVSDARTIEQAARQIAELMAHYIKTSTQAGESGVTLSEAKTALDAAYTTFTAA